MGRYLAHAGLLGTLNKHVSVLAIEPRSMALTGTSRKIYNVMIRLAQLNRPSEDGFYSAPLSDVINFAGSSTKIASRIQQYIDQMVQTSVLLHLVSETDAQTLPLEGFAPAATSSDDDLKDGEERRTFPLLAEVRWTRSGGRHELAWCFPPSIRELLLNPDRWAQIEFTSLVALNSYTAVALYEILARYKDAPGGLTARHSPEWWSRILREGGPAVKLREWRKFKSELLAPALKEINAKTEVEAELVERRERGVVVDVQFKVSRRAERPAPPGTSPIDVSLPLRAAALGVRDDELDQLVSQFGAMKVSEGLDALEMAIAKPASHIVKRGAYLRTILGNKFPDGAVGGEELLSPAERPNPERKASEAQALTEAWRRSRLSELEAEFTQLPGSEQVDWILAAAKTLPMTPGLKRRVDERDWRSPIIRHAVLGAYASDRYGPAWGVPSAEDLAVFAERPSSVRAPV
jgi:hypothetical protein